MNNETSTDLVPTNGKEEPLDVVLVDPAAEPFVGYQGAGTLRLTPEEDKALGEMFPDEVRDILPTGEVYVSHVHVRHRLNTVIGRGQWALIPRSKETLAEGNVAQKWALTIRGHYVAEAWGEMEYHESSDRSTYPSAIEGAKSNALTRCVKDLGIGWECWDKRKCEAFKAEFCVQVWRKPQGAKNKPQWRRKDATPWYDETGLVGKKDQPPEPQKPPATTPSKPAPEGPPIQEGHRDLLLQVGREKGLVKGKDSTELKKFIAKTLGRDIASSQDVIESEFQGLLDKLRLV